jgi:hypothetical protein
MPERERRHTVSEVAALGFDSSAPNALANAPILSEGLYGTPPYEPPSSPSGGVCGESWDAVSAVVTNPLGAVLAIVGEVWTLTLAVDTFVDHIAIEAAKIDGKLPSMEAAALVYVGKVVVGALNEFLQWILQQVEELLSRALSPLTQANDAYFEASESDFVAGYDRVSDDQTVTQAQSNALWTTLSGGDFEFETGFSVAVAAALTLLSVVSLGATLLAPMILQIVVGSVVGGLPSSVNPLSLFDSSTTWATSIEAIWNLANTTGSTVLSHSATAVFTWIQLFGELFAGSALGVLLGIALLAITTGSFYCLTYVGVAGLIFGILAILAYYYYETSGATNGGLLWFAIIMSILGAGASAAGLLLPSALGRTVGTTVAVTGLVLNLAAAGVIWEYH